MKLTKETVSEIVAEMKQLLVGVGAEPRIEINSGNPDLGLVSVWDFNRDASYDIIRAYGDTPEEAVAAFMLKWSEKPDKAQQKRLDAARLLAEADKLDAEAKAKEATP